MDWYPAPTLVWRDPRCTELTAEAFGILMRLYGRARESLSETLRVPGLSPVALVAHVGGVSAEAATEALATLQERGLIDCDGEGVTLTVGWPLPSARPQAGARGSDEHGTDTRPSRLENEPVRAMRKRAAALFAHQGLKTQESRLAWIDSAEGAEVLRRRRIDSDTARSVATNEPLRPGHDPRTRRVTSVSGASDTGDTGSGHGVSDPIGHGAQQGVSESVGHGSDTDSDTASRARASEEERRGEEKRREHTHIPDTRETDTDTSDTDTKVGHGHDPRPGHGVSLPSVEQLGAHGLDADEVVDILRRRAAGKILLTYDSHTLVALKKLLGDLHQLGQVSRARVELLADWIGAGGLSWRSSGKPGVLYLCKPGVLAQHLGEALEWEAEGRRRIERRAPAGAQQAGAARARADEDEDDAAPEGGGAAQWEIAVDVTEERLRAERGARAGARAPKDVAHAG